MSKGHHINEIHIAKIKGTYGRIVGARSNTKPYGLYQYEWLVQVKTDSGLVGVTNAAPVSDPSYLFWPRSSKSTALAGSST